MIKFFINIFIFFMSFTAFFNFVEAGFLDGNLGLDLYKDIKEGLSDFEYKQYFYEMQGQKAGSFAENINLDLQQKGFGDCLKEGFTNEDIEKISYGVYAPLIDKLKSECYDSNGETYSQKDIIKITKEIINLRHYYSKIVEEKTKAIEDIATVGIYADGNIENSSFDLISDIEDIDRIIFKTKNDYETDYDLQQNMDDYEAEVANPGLDLVGNNTIETGIIGTEEESEEVEKIKITTSTSNNYSCSPSNPFFEVDYGNVDVVSETDSLSGVFLSGGLLPITNKIGVPFLSNSGSNDIVYEKPKDNGAWGCDGFFCIVVDFIKHDFDPLQYVDPGETGVAGYSIENIFETASRHLKKGATTSLVQHKMTTNNFEIGLRDLNLPDIFHIGIVIVSQSSPLLNIEKEKNFNEKKDENEVFVKDLLVKKYETYGLDYREPNSFKKFVKVEQELKGISKSFANPFSRVTKFKDDYDYVMDVKNKIDDYLITEKSQEINNSIISDFDKQFMELESFTKQMYDFVQSARDSINRMDEIPTYSG